MNKKAAGRHYGFIISENKEESILKFKKRSVKDKKITRNLYSSGLFAGADDGNRTHTVSHTPLKRARLPVPPHPHPLNHYCEGVLNSKSYYNQPSGACQRGLGNFFLGVRGRLAKQFLLNRKTLPIVLMNHINWKNTGTVRSGRVPSK